MKKHHLHMTCASSLKQLSGISDGGMVTPLRQLQSEEPKKHVSHGSKSLESLMRVAYTAADFIDRGNHMTPTRSPRERISAKWREIHGQFNWESLLDPLHPWLRREIVKYGEFSQATYDAFDYDSFSDFCGSCRHNRHKLFDELHLTKHGYKVTKYIYAMTNIDVPSCDNESQRIGRRDIVVAWRGTASLEQMGEGGVKVMEEVKRLLEFFKGRGEEVSLTITGHSLGGALALLNAYEAASSLPDLDHISVISFGAPRVGNIAFRDKMNEMGVKILRVVMKQDIVPKLPGIICNKILRQIHALTRRLKWVYRHIGSELKLDVIVSLLEARI
ncbi:hypothetical protein AAG906_028408 [Vitis piasezkii]